MHYARTTPKSELVGAPTAADRRDPDTALTGPLFVPTVRKLLACPPPLYPMCEFSKFEIAARSSERFENYRPFPNCTSFVLFPLRNDRFRKFGIGFVFYSCGKYIKERYLKRIAIFKESFNFFNSISISLILSFYIYSSISFM